MQETAVYVIIAISVAYGMIKIHKLIKEHNDPCKGCSGCALKDYKKERCKFKQEDRPANSKKKQST